MFVDEPDDILLSMDFITAIAFGLIQGITELLPISSTGHLVLAREVVAVTSINALALEGVLHFAAALAILTYFWGDVWILLQALIRKLSRLPANGKDLTLLYALASGTLPAVLMGLLLEETLTKYLKQPEVVATMLFFGAIFYMYAEWRYYLSPPQGALTLKRGFVIGLFQVLALIPGLSRFGSAIAGGMLSGLTRYEAARFSYLLAIPLTFGLGLKKLLDLMSTEGVVDWPPIALAAAVCFIMALLTIRFFLVFIRHNTLWPFIWYNIILACLVGYVALFI